MFELFLLVTALLFGGMVLYSFGFAAFVFTALPADVAGPLIKLLGRGEVEHIPFPEELQGKYQSFTEADVSGLRAAGYGKPFTSLEDGVASSLAEWQRESRPAQSPPGRPGRKDVGFSA